MACQSCAHWAPKRAAKMANHGFGCCAHAPIWKYFPPAHTCPKHKPADESVTQSRTVWLHKLDAKASKTPSGASKQEMKGRTA